MTLWLVLFLLPRLEALSFHSYYGDGMVLQRDVPVQVWGYADNSLINDLLANLECVIGDGLKTSKVTLAPRKVEDGVWSFELPSRSAEFRCNVEVSGGGDVISLTNVLYGDVWICSGQSNMEQTMTNIMNASEEIEMSSSYKTIRYMVVKNAATSETSDTLDIELQVPWSDPSSPNLWGMSAVCFLFARNIQDMMQAEGDPVVPLGMVDSDWGGTPIEAWSTQETLDMCDIPTQNCNEESPQNCNSRLYNAMINPLKKNAVKGFLWYQGESNGNKNRDKYNCTFPAMIDSWRQEFSSNSATSKTAAFGFVQLASFKADSISAAFPVIRWHQTADMGLVPNDRMDNVFMASPLDTYDPKEGYPGGIHPRYKQIVGERLAVAGMSVAYKYNEPYAPYGPFPSSFKIEVGDAILINYDSPIVYNENAEISGFYVCTDTAEACDSGLTVSNWVEVAKEDVNMEDDHLISINMQKVDAPGATISLAHIWRETPVKEYLGLPLYGGEPFHLPSPPWKTTFIWPSK